MCRLNTKIAFLLDCPFGLVDCVVQFPFLINFNIQSLLFSPLCPDHCWTIAITPLSTWLQMLLTNKWKWRNFWMGCVTIVARYDSFWCCMAYNWITFHGVLILVCLKIIFNWKCDTAEAAFLEIPSAAAATTYVQSIFFVVWPSIDVIRKIKQKFSLA